MYAHAGVAHCARVFGHDAVMNINPCLIEQDNPAICIRAQASGLTYPQSLERFPLTEREEVELGFIGDFHAPSYPDGMVETATLTPIMREALAMYQVAFRHYRPAKAA
jgi:hypothetical protein